MCGVVQVLAQILSVNVGEIPRILI